MDKQPWTRGSVILMHDGGGDRSATVAALPVLIQTLRSHGYQIVPVAELVGKTRAEVMPPLNQHQLWQARVDSLAFFFYAFFNFFVVNVFFIGDVLMSSRGSSSLASALSSTASANARTLLPRLLPASSRPYPRLQRRDRHRPHHPFGHDVELQEHPHRRHRRRLNRFDPPRSPRRLPEGHRIRPPYHPHQAQRREGRSPQLRP